MRVSFYNLSQLFVYCHVFLYTCFYFYFEQVNFCRKVIKIVLNLDNSFGAWRDCRKRAENECINLRDQ